MVRGKVASKTSLDLGLNKIKIHPVVDLWRVSSCYFCHSFSFSSSADRLTPRQIPELLSFRCGRGGGARDREEVMG